MKINLALISRSIIALLFVVAGVQKIINFANISAFVGSLGVPFPEIATAVIILIEIPIALMFAYGYKIRETGYIIIGFIILATLLVHKNYFGSDLITVLKNMAIVGGILSSIGCSCSRPCGCAGGICGACHMKK